MFIALREGWFIRRIVISSLPGIAHVGVSTVIKVTWLKNTNRPLSHCAISLALVWTTATSRFITSIACLGAIQVQFKVCPSFTLLGIPLKIHIKDDFLEYVNWVGKRLKDGDVGYPVVYMSILQTPILLYIHNTISGTNINLRHSGWRRKNR